MKEKDNTKIKIIDLNSKIAVYVPTTYNTDEECDTEAYRYEIEEKMAICFGGFNTSPVNGGWYSKKKGVIRELNYCVESFCTTSQLEEHLDEVIIYAKKLLIELKQEAVMIEVNGNGKIIELVNDEQMAL